MTSTKQQQKIIKDSVFSGCCCYCSSFVVVDTVVAGVTLYLAGAALGPLLTGIISPTGWRNVFYMLISADVAALIISCYIYVIYDRSAASGAGPSSLDSDCRCRRVHVKPPCCRLTMFYWALLSAAVLTLSLVVIILPDVYYHSHRQAR